MRYWIDIVVENKRDFERDIKPARIPATPENIEAARNFVTKKWLDRWNETKRGTPPSDLSSSCKFTSLFAREIFGGSLEGNYDHQYVRAPNGEIIDLNLDAADVKQLGDKAHIHDLKFWGSNDHRNSLNSCKPRVDTWVDEFLQNNTEIKEDVRKGVANTMMATGLALAGANSIAPQPTPEPSYSVELPDSKPYVDPTAKIKKEKNMLALTIWAEARNEGAKGMEAVGHVIKNRADADRPMFGDGITGVVTKRKQFSCWNPNDPNFQKMKNITHLSKDSPDYKRWLEALQIADKIISGKSPDKTQGALFYHTSDVNPAWAGTMRKIGSMAGHIFYKPKSKST